MRCSRCNGDDTLFSRFLQVREWCGPRRLRSSGIFRRGCFGVVAMVASFTVKMVQSRFALMLGEMKLRVLPLLQQRGCCVFRLVESQVQVIAWFVTVEALPWSEMKTELQQMREKEDAIYVEMMVVARSLMVA